MFTLRDTAEEINMWEWQYGLFINAPISSRYEVWFQTNKMANPRQLITGVTNLYQPVSKNHEDFKIYDREFNICNVCYRPKPFVWVGIVQSV